jgi:hypothetical protein
MIIILNWIIQEISREVVQQEEKHLRDKNQTETGNRKGNTAQIKDNSAFSDISWSWLFTGSPGRVGRWALA